MLSDKIKQKKVDKKTTELNKDLSNKQLASSIEAHKDIMQKLFIDDDTFIDRIIVNNHNKSLKFYLAYNDSLVNTFVINENIVKPLMISKVAQADSVDVLIEQVILISEAKKTKLIKEVIDAITYGDTVVFSEGTSEAIILNTKSFTARSITEPDNEKVIVGPREGFAEVLMPNLSLIRRRLKTNDLKLKFHSIGGRTNTSACVCYLDSLVNKKILEKLIKRLEQIQIDGVLDTNYLVELIKEHPYSLFRTIGYTERPDVVVAKLLEGRIAVIMDGSPVVLTLPYLFIENFQSCEDYYTNPFYSSFTRLLRILSFILTISIVALYVSTVSFHREMIPTQLLINIAGERQNVPLPAAFEGFLMLIIFALLKEAGVRMPSNTGQALSIVGALVIGQAAVEAKLVASPMIIIVAISGITGLLVNKLSPTIIYLQIFLLTLASTFGFYGLNLGICLVFIYILNLHSFGIPQITLSGNLQFQEVKDIMIRAPWWQMKKRPNQLTKDQVRMTIKGDQNNE